MLVMIIENVTPSLRGTISRWMIEPKAGVFVGKVSALVRDRLWVKCTKSKPDGNFVQIWSTNNEQGFMARTWGDRSRELVNHEGILLVHYVSQVKRD